MTREGGRIHNVSARETTAGARRAHIGHAHPRHADPRSRKIALGAVQAALDKKALEPVLMDVHDLASYADYILIVSGRSDRQVESIADGVVAALAADGVRPIGIEGVHSGKWALIDFGDLIVHVFHHPLREYYDLESLWSDAPRVEIEVPPEARVSPGDVY